MTRPDFTRSAFLRGGAAVAAGTISSSIMAAVLTTILGVQLGEEGYGTYAFVIAAAGLLAAVGRVGVAPIVVRDIARSVSAEDTLGRREPILNALVVAGTATAFVAIITVSPAGRAVLESIADLDTTTVLALTALFAAQSIYVVNAESLRGMHLQGWATLVGLPTHRAVNLVLVAFVIWVASDDLGIAQALWLTAIAGLATVAFSGLVLGLRSRVLPLGGVHVTDGLRMASAGVPVMLTNILGVLSNRMGVFVLVSVSAAADAGVFALAAGYVAVIRLAHGTMLSTVSPFIATSYHAGERSLLERRLRLVAAGTSSLAAVAGIALIFGTVLFVPKIFGSDFGGSVPVAAVLVGGTLFTTFAGPCGVMLNVTGNERWMTRAMGISVVVGAVTMVPAALAWGAIGVAGAEAGMITLRVVLQLRYTARQTGIDTRADFAAFYRAIRRTVSGSP